MNSIKIGVSQCLLGDPVRYDGGHKKDSFITNTLGKWFDFVPVCPEVECGLGVPREAMRLVGSPEAPRLLTRKTGVDLSDRMQKWSEKRILELEKEDLCGFIFKARSPSSGMERVKIYKDTGGIAGFGRGLFADAFMKHFPLLPVEEEGRLNDPVLRENFIVRIFTLKRYRDTVRAEKKIAALMRFHAENKFLITSHSDRACREMGRKLAESPRRFNAVASEYEELLLKTLKMKATVKKHVNVLQHIMGFLKKELDSAEKRELLDIIDSYHKGYVPLIVPVTLLNHYARKFKVDYLLSQTYLNPHPMEMKLRNHA